MADLFLSYSRADKARAGQVAGVLEAEGRSLWWDRQLASGEDYGTVIEREIAAARRVVVGWSGTARESLWVRAEANEALDQGKLVQINFDGAKPPLPFTMLHFLDFRAWDGGAERAPWPDLRAELDKESRDVALAGGFRPDPGGVPLVERSGPALQGFGKVAALGWAALVVAILLALSVLLVVRGFISAEAFGVISIGAAAVAALLLGATAFIVLRVSMAGRR